MKWLIALFTITCINLAIADEFVIDDPNSRNQAANPPEKRAPVQPVLSIGSVQTPQTLPKGRLFTEFVFYDNGGINTRMIVGIFDIFSIGISENFDHVIGFEQININIPGAFVKLSLLRDLGNFDAAVGFDSSAYGRNGSYTMASGITAVVYGFFTSFGFKYSVFRGNDSFNFGFRIPLFPFELTSVSNSSIYLATTISLSSHFSAGLTVENIYLDASRFAWILPSLIASFIPIPELKLSVIMQYEFYSSRFNRILALNYEAQF